MHDLESANAPGIRELISQKASKTEEHIMMRAGSGITMSGVGSDWTAHLPNVNVIQIYVTFLAYAISCFRHRQKVKAAVSQSIRDITAHIHLLKTRQGPAIQD